MSSRPLKTTLDFKSLKNPVGLQSGLMMIGSCFAEHIGQRLIDCQFPSLTVNPCGVTYNPMAIARMLGALMGTLDLRITQHEGLWHSWDHHGRFSHSEEDILRENIENEWTPAVKSLKNAKHLFLTFGTSFEFRLQEDGSGVNNCHKLPSSLFERQLLSIDEIVSTWHELLLNLETHNPDLNIVFSISPVRHLRDGLIDNQRSKAILLESVHQLMALHPRASYMPTYEFFMDELRDYRFYADDLLHPSAMAVDMVLQKFTQHYLSAEASDFLSEMESWRKMNTHRMLHPDTVASKEFNRNKELKYATLTKKYPFLGSQTEIRK